MIHTRACFMSHLGEYMMKEDIFLPLSSMIISGEFKIPETAQLGDDPESNNLHGKSTGEDRTELLSSGILVLPISGATMPKESKHGGTSTIRIRSIVNAAKTDPEVKAIMLKMNTPGGHVEGNHIAANVLNEFSQVKPMFAHTEEMMASAGVWLGLQAERVTASPMATIGSLGTVSTVYDFTGQFEKAGIKAFVISTGKFKGMGFPGSELTKDHIAFFENRVQELNAFFKDAVLQSRGFTKETVNRLFDGSYGLAAEALSNNLVDGVETYEEALERLEQRISTSTQVAQSSFVKSKNIDSEENKNSVVDPDNPDATMEIQIKQNSKENEVTEKLTSVSEVKKAYPTMCAEIEASAVEKALEKEQSRVNDWSSFSDVDTKAVQEGIASGKTITIVQATALQAKRSDPAFKASLIEESPEAVVTPKEDAPEASEAEKEVATIIANAEKLN